MIALHDANVVYRALLALIGDLETQGRTFREIVRRHDRVMRHPLVGLARSIGLVAAARRMFGLR